MIERAKELQQSGKTYAQIAEELDKPLDWVKKRLRTRKNSPKYPVLLEKALQPSGIADTGLTTNARKVLRAKDRQALIRPAWIDPEAPAESFRDMHQIAMSINDILHERVQEYLKDYPDTEYKAIMRELEKLTFGYGSGEPIGLHINRTHDIVLEILRRKDVQANKREKDG